MRIHTIDITQEVAELIGSLSIKRQDNEYIFQFQRSKEEEYVSVHIDLKGKYTIVDNECHLELINYSQVETGALFAYVDEKEVCKYLLSRHAEKCCTWIIPENL
jgi:hypothetical protein